jgi:hypothetical protein
VERFKEISMKMAKDSVEYTRELKELREEN